MAGPVVVAENRALARRPLVLGLPLGYAAVLIMTVLYLCLSAGLVFAGVYVLAVGWGVGKFVTEVIDPWAWELLWRCAKVPSRLRV